MGLRSRRDDECGFVKLGDALKKEIRRLGLNKNARLRKLDTAWASVVSKEMEPFTFVVSLRGGKLTVEVSNAAIMSELVNFHKVEILKKMNAVCEKVAISDIRFVLKGK